MNKQLNLSDNVSIDETYDKLIKTADIAASEGFTMKFGDNLKEISEDLNNINASYEDQKPDPNLENVDIPENIKNTSEKVMQSYNPINGETMIMDGKIVKEITDQQFKNFTSADFLDNLVSNIKNTNSSIKDEDAIKLASAIAHRMDGENVIYDYLPDDMKRVVNQIMISVNTSNLKKSQIKNKNFVACQLIDEFIKEMKGSPDLALDLDTMLAGFDEDVEKFENKMSSEMADMFVSFDDDRKASIDAAINRCKENNNTEAIEKLTQMKNSIDYAYSLEDFKEFCKNCKIKNFDIKKTSRIFDPFNAKYENHKNVINDIRSCPTILDRHLTKNNSIQNLMICLAFCKFCSNMSPDNMNEHTFMYYFIRNIIAIDRMNPKGRIYDTMEEKHKAFYDGFVANLYECSSNLLERNPTFK